MHPGQAAWLAGAVRPENLLVTGNRWGKSYVSAVRALHRAFFRIRPLRFDESGPYRVVTASITQDQANITFNRAVRLARQSAVLEPLIDSVVRTPYPRLSFSNGAEIEARSTQNRGEYLLGNDYDLFIFDEVAFQSDPEYVVEEVIMMRLADREGILDLVSTPNGKNWFYLRADEIASGKRPGYLQSGDSRENTTISARALEQRLASFSERRVSQNIMGRFVDCGGEILAGELVDAALTLARPHSSQPSGSFISGWDLARKQTATVGITVAVVDNVVQVVALERFRQHDWTVILERIAARQRAYPGQLVVDGTGLGDVIVAQLSAYNPQAVIFTERTKAQLLINLELMHARRRIAYDRWELPDGPGRTWSLEHELRRARWDDNSECDAVMALALALWPLREPRQPAIAPRVAGIRARS